MKKPFWIFMMSATMVLWGCLPVTGFILFPENHSAPFVFPGILFAFHALELPIAFRIGRELDIPNKRVMIHTLLFGFTWWVPLKQNVWNPRQ